ncbi:MAG: DUF2721 domain-containing protein [Rhizomicrobium sp.]|jgi:hypothetical protein
MALSANPFVVLSYVSGPAILTNAAALLLLSTSNRFGRAIDRSRSLATNVGELSESGREELQLVARRVRLLAHVLSSLYLSTAIFALATLTSILGAAAAEFAPQTALQIVVIAAVVLGVCGFAAFIAGATGLVIESRLAVQALARETDEALSSLNKIERVE